MFLEVPYIKNLNSLAINDLVVLKSKYVNPTTKENYLKVFAIGVITGRHGEKSINVKWINSFIDSDLGFKKIDNIILWKDFRSN